MTAPDDIAGVMVSLKPEFAKAVAEGRKTVELRRRFPTVAPGAWLVIYATQPVGAVVGISRIECVESRSVSSIWRKHRSRAAISKPKFHSYFAAQTHGYAVLLGEYEPVGPIASGEVKQIIPGFCPPQSWRYLDFHALEALRTLSTP